MEIYAISMQLLNIFSHAHTFSGKWFSIFFAGYSMKEPSISTMHLLYRWSGCISAMSFAVTQIRSEGPSFWNQANLNFNSNGLKVAKLRTPQLFGFTNWSANLYLHHSLLRVIPTNWHVIMTLYLAYYLAPILTLFVTCIQTFHLANMLTCFLTIYLTYILTYLTWIISILTLYLIHIVTFIWRIVWHSIWHMFEQVVRHVIWYDVSISSDSLVDIDFDIRCDIYSCNLPTIFYLTLREPTIYKKLLNSLSLHHQSVFSNSKTCPY